VPDLPPFAADRSPDFEIDMVETFGTWPILKI
jgi:hypothetical protein